MRERRKTSSLPARHQHANDQQDGHLAIFLTVVKTLNITVTHGVQWALAYQVGVSQAEAQTAAELWYRLMLLYVGDKLQLPLGYVSVTLRLR